MPVAHNPLWIQVPCRRHRNGDRAWGTPGKGRARHARSAGARAGRRLLHDPVGAGLPDAFDPREIPTAEQKTQGPGEDALVKISAQVRQWRLHRRTGHSFAQLAKAIDPIVAGWMHYYGRFYRPPLLMRINACLRGIAVRYPRMFAHWAWITAASPL
ncbi:group II intron maturase-specific domain-containing protein [Nonomuraea longispora]|uniref:group II intron maturase-specific domain-containing protein n=1 Tax=Nonomuraea longispora TaxID=1848320 RepID=UPI001C703BED|nr:group II intron maturase-specific domain-containing protein [Nonomuraea longispora]